MSVLCEHDKMKLSGQRSNAKSKGGEMRKSSHNENLAKSLQAKEYNWSYPKDNAATLWC